MAAEPKPEIHLEIAHVLYMDVVGYSKLLTNEQRELVQLLNQIVRETKQFKSAEAAEKLVRLTTGDGMALAFFTTPDAPVRCAQEISRKLKDHPELHLRMGINSGPVDEVSDVNDRRNVAGVGINMAQRVMDCGDAGHILLSRRVADDLGQYTEWRAYLHPLGEVDVKHGVRVEVANLYGDGFGNPKVPEKIARAVQERTAAAARAAKEKRRRIIFGSSAAFLLLLCLALGFWLWQRRTVPSSARKVEIAAIPEKSIAVLPFENFGNEQENAYFADGVQDDILTNLAKIADLKVISRRSVAQYRGSTQRIRDIGQALQVAYVLEGTVRKIGDKVRVSAQLINTRTEAEKWAEKYERELADVFAIQNEISETIASQLKATLSPEEKTAIETASTRNMEAYDLYLRARGLVYAFGTYAKQREENQAKAKPLLEAAIARDPKFVLAYCLLAEVEYGGSYPSWGVEKGSPEAIARARNLLNKALSLAPESGEVHLQLGSFYNVASGDWKRAKEEFTAALQKLPNSVQSHAALAALDREQSNWREALQHARRAVELDPRDPAPAADLADMYRALRRYDEAAKELDRMIPILPPASTSWLWTTKGELAEARGDTKAAMAAYDMNPLRNAGVVGANHRVAHVLLLERRYDEAAALLSSVEAVARAHDTLDQAGISEWALAKANLDLGIIGRAQGKPERALAGFEAAKKTFAAYLATQRSVETALAYQAMCDAGLGDKEAALRQARQAQELGRKSQDRSRFTVVGKRVAAVVYAWCGDHAVALDQLEAIVGLPDSVNVGDLKLNPQWDDLRGEPRFQRVVAEAAKPVKID
jgi:TolB-like protein/Tfp pilus assembly protein PilF